MRRRRRGGFERVNGKLIQSIAAKYNILFATTSSPFCAHKAGGKTNYLYC
jgi:hypothetical protein